MAAAGRREDARARGRYLVTTVTLARRQVRLLDQRAAKERRSRAYIVRELLDRALRAEMEATV